MIKSKKDLYSGLMFVAIGGFFALWARNYPMGTAVRMGPAYFPTILGAICAILGLIILVRAFTTEDEDPNPTQWKPLLLILSSAVVFGLFMDPFKAGFIVSVFATVILCASGGYEFKWKETIIESVVLAVVCYGAFVYGLGLPFRLFPWSF